MYVLQKETDGWEVEALEPWRVGFEGLLVRDLVDVRASFYITDGVSRPRTEIGGMGTIFPGGGCGLFYHDTMPCDTSAG